ncbi:unnamed protein product [Caenorhabditis auriculariae]|uniref:Uncharacterized protein n=1 Tax=Caenorhabditis auriculariae TaxID=2777116 RepID=A0A8S1HRH1_9PELO|nr:unnamed protein product [Caenorhabditis auriculariae]
MLLLPISAVFLTFFYATPVFSIKLFLKNPSTDANNWQPQLTSVGQVFSVRPSMWTGARPLSPSLRFADEPQRVQRRLPSTFLFRRRRDLDPRPFFGNSWDYLD